jgi:hypothetical protein
MMTACMTDHEDLPTSRFAILQRLITVKKHQDQDIVYILVLVLASASSRRRVERQLKVTLLLQYTAAATATDRVDKIRNSVQSIFTATAVFLPDCAVRFLFVRNGLLHEFVILQTSVRPP